MDKVLNIEPLEEEMFRFKWDPRVLNTPLYQREILELTQPACSASAREIWDFAQDTLAHLQSMTSEPKAYILSVYALESHFSRVSG